MQCYGNFEIVEMLTSNEAGCLFRKRCNRGGEERRTLICWKSLVSRESLYSEGTRDVEDATVKHHLKLQLLCHSKLKE